MEMSSGTAVIDVEVELGKKNCACFIHSITLLVASHWAPFYEISDVLMYCDWALSVLVSRVPPRALEAFTVRYTEAVNSTHCVSEALS
jgi:alanine dehydrogenase